LNHVGESSDACAGDRFAGIASAQDFGSVKEGDAVGKATEEE
jgi:hypothetical protein